MIRIAFWFLTILIGVAVLFYPSWDGFMLVVGMIALGQMIPKLQGAG